MSRELHRAWEREAARQRRRAAQCETFYAVCALLGVAALGAYWLAREVAMWKVVDLLW